MKRGQNGGGIGRKMGKILGELAAENQLKSRRRRTKSTQNNGNISQYFIKTGGGKSTQIQGGG
jgi:hypothetical protein